MRQILAGIETEYGLFVEDHGAEEQIDDAIALVRGYPGECFPLWNYRYESPRSDLRGFKLDHLAFDPTDAQFDRPTATTTPEDVRSDRILPNGARFYNDHGHPEYSTPECLSIRELALHDAAGENVVLAAARVLEEVIERPVRIYKNNTDFHGASYGTHESYLAPRALGFQRLYEAVMPMLVARQILTGAGKAGSETGRPCRYQISQRADFFVEPFNTETLFRRPIFNTRDEPHADPRDWIRLHVISGDANMMRCCTARKVGLVKLAVALAEAGEAPVWRFQAPVGAFQAISRDDTGEFCIPLESRSWTNAYEVLESYLAAAERVLDLDSEMTSLVAECRRLMAALIDDEASVAGEIDWLAKRRMLTSILEEEGMDWDSPSLQAFDLEYHRVDPEEGLFHALQEMGEVEPPADRDELRALLWGVREPTRARARGLALTRFGSHVINACWSSVTFQVAEHTIEVPLPPDRTYPAQLETAPDVESFIEMLRGER